VTDRYAYNPYGKLLAHQGSSTQPFTFVGQWGVRQEGQSGTLYQMRARYYDAASARFLSPDPVWPNIADPRQINPYPYAANNPLQWIDVTGESLLLNDMSIFDPDFTIWSTDAPAVNPPPVVNIHNAVNPYANTMKRFTAAQASAEEAVSAGSIAAGIASGIESGAFSSPGAYVPLAQQHMGRRTTAEKEWDRELTECKRRLTEWERKLEEEKLELELHSDWAVLILFVRIDSFNRFEENEDE